MAQRLLKILFLFLLNCNICYGYDWTQDADCQGAWLFTEGSGATVADSSQNTNTGNFLADGEPAWASISGTGAPSYAPYMVTYDAVDDVINCGTDASIDNFWASGGSSAGWINITGYGESSTLGGQIMSKEGGVWSIRYISNTSPIGPVVNFFHTTSGTFGSWNTNVNAVSTGEWHHFAVTFDKDSIDNLPIFYLDGTSITVNEFSNPTGAFASDATSSLGLGNRVSDTARTFSGSLSETSVFSVILDSTDINDIMDNGLLQAGGAQTYRRRVI